MPVMDGLTTWAPCAPRVARRTSCLTATVAREGGGGDEGGCDGFPRKQRFRATAAASSGPLEKRRLQRVNVALAEHAAAAGIVTGTSRHARTADTASARRVEATILLCGESARASSLGRAHSCAQPAQHAAFVYVNCVAISIAHRIDPLPGTRKAHSQARLTQAGGWRRPRGNGVSR